MTLMLASIMAVGVGAYATAGPGTGAGAIPVDGSGIPLPPRLTTTTAPPPPPPTTTTVPPGRGPLGGTPGDVEIGETVNATITPDPPDEFDIDRSVNAVTLSWSDNSSDEAAFAVQRRDRDGNWVSMERLPTRNRPGQGDQYTWQDFEKWIWFQCYRVLSGADGWAATDEKCTVRPDPDLFAQNVPSAARQWSDYGLQSGEPARLANKTDGYIRHGDRHWGVHLEWGQDGQNVTYQRRAEASTSDLLFGEPVAIKVEGGGWLQHEHQTFGINLGFSSTPSYEWHLLGRDPGWILSGYVALWNSVAEDFVVYADRPVGINLRWYKDTVDDSEPAPDPEPEPDPQGVSRLVVYNCHSDHRGLRMWVWDITAGTPWSDEAYLAQQWPSSGPCPGIGEPWQFTPVDGHQYMVRAVDYSAPGCENSPTTGCWRQQLTFTGDTDGVPYSSTVS